VVIDTIAESGAIESVLPKIKEMLGEGLVITLDVEVEHYNKNNE
jgi:PII-like signaling protein